ncbi:MAG: D-alanyl-D-alanine carboxypeptidase family protein [Clostridiales bacterium]|nr:D-alanyl-D-alanine carboxypeptidase family protein [Clostridiales bacterium]
MRKKRKNAKGGNSLSMTMVYGLLFALVVVGMVIYYDSHIIAKGQTEIRTSDSTPATESAVYADITARTTYRLSPTPSPTPALSASPIPSPRSALTPTPFPTPRPSPSPTPSPTPRPTRKATPTPQPASDPTSPSVTETDPSTTPNSGSSGTPPTTQNVPPTPASAATPTPTPIPTPVPGEPVYINGFLDPRSVTPEIISNPSSITALVNKYHAVTKDYVPSLVPAKSSNGRYIRPEAADAWDLMREACHEDTGKTLYLTSGYRSYATQKASFENAIINKGLERAVSKYAYPGRSEHQLGLALDIATTSYKTISGSFLSTEAGQWMTEHAHEYGFILRYPSGKESITGYAFEAWHYRYIGVDAATAMHSSGQTLEEYLGKT